MRHVHKYRRFKTVKGKPYYRCMVPNCAHILYDHKLILGRANICWGCLSPHNINEKSSQQMKPLCDDCIEARKVRLERMKNL